MIDNKKITKSRNLAASVIVGTVMLGLSLVAVTDYFQKSGSKKDFDKLSKPQQEMVLKLKNDKSKEKTIQLNLTAKDELKRLSEAYDGFVVFETKLNSIPVVNIDEQVKRITNQSNLLKQVVQLRKDVINLKGKLTLDPDLIKQMEDLIKVMASFEEQLDTEIMFLKNMQFRN